jgi:hypothetical protein
MLSWLLTHYATLSVILCYHFYKVAEDLLALGPYICSWEGSGITANLFAIKNKEVKTQQLSIES